MSSDKFSEVIQAVVDLLKNNFEDLGLPGPDDVYYGDQARLPRTPSVTVMGGGINRQLTQTGIQAVNNMAVILMIYHSPYINSEVSQKQTDEFTEGIEALLHQNRRLGGLVIHSHVSANEPGAAERAGTLLKVTRLTLSCTSKTVITP